MKNKTESVPFHNLAKAVEKQFKKMCKGGAQLYVTDVPGDDLWRHYLAAFPEGSNPIYVTNTEHDCNCCKSFIRRVGNVVGIKDGKLQTIWDVGDVGYPYTEVAAALATCVRGHYIRDIFVTSEREAGRDFNMQETEVGKYVKWEHFHVKINAKHHSTLPDTAQGKARSAVGLIQRSLETLTKGAVETVLDLVQSNQLYRGTEDVKKVLQEFQAAQVEYNNLPNELCNPWLWNNHNKHHLAIRNTAIGSLLQTLSAGAEVGAAVKVYERMVAPANYKRKSAPITTPMVDKAMKQVDDLGLRGSLERRHATLQDVSINDVLWASRTASQAMRDPLKDLLAAAVKPPASRPQERDLTPLPIEAFLAEVLPSAKKLEVLFGMEHLGNLVSVTAPVHQNAEPLFRWGNPYAWAYRGDVTDSIKERVKQKGGKVDGWGRVSLGWYNWDDLDLAVFEPDGTKIWYSDRAPSGQMGGILDVDMNVQGESGPSNVNSDHAVENITWSRKMATGLYQIQVTNYTKRDPENVGFEVEIDINGTTETLHCHKGQRSGGVVKVANIRVCAHGLIDIAPAKGGSIIKAPRQVTEWGLQTGSFREVDTLLLSPNCWGDREDGLKHWLFIMKGCENPETTRGFYNEFLRSDLRDHAKVFEVLGALAKCPFSEEQLSGLGFSSTTRNQVVVRVDDARQYTVTF